jgi:hypothetical protein
MPQSRQKYKTRYKATLECALHPDKTWQWLPHFEGRFMVSSCGDVRMHQSFNSYGMYTLKQPRMLRQIPLKNKYMTIHIQTNRVRVMYYVHRLVLYAFHGNPPPDHEAGHLDGTRINNHLDNLQWITRKENANHKREHGTLLCGDKHPTTKIPDAEIPVILKALAQRTPRDRLAVHYGVSVSAIDMIATHKRRVTFFPSAQSKKD